jgi:phosphoribosylglycinamide formyltransferase 1
MQAIIDAIAAKQLNAKISVVISNKKDAYALDRAKRHNIETVFIDSKNKDREEYDKEVSTELDIHNVDLILLIGYMRILSPWFVNKYKDKIMNIHPSLLPAFSGGMDKDVHAEVLKARVKETGCTLHFVDESVDKGPIIMQKKVRIDENDSIESLKAKVQEAEQEVILEALKLYSEGKIKVENNKVIISD